MTNRTRILALCLALLSLFAFAAADEAVTDDILVTIGDFQIKASDVTETAALLYENGVTETENDYDYTIDYMVNQQLLRLRMNDMGFMTFTEEELAAFKASAEADWENALTSYVSYFLSEDTEEARAALREQAIDYYENTMGITLDDVITSYQESAAYEKLEAVLFADVSITEEQVKALFDEQVALYKQDFENNIAYYEYYINYQGGSSWYRPEGYRAVTHILLQVDEALLSDYQSKLAAMEEEPAEGETPVTQADVDAAYQAVLDSVADTTKDIYTRLDAGESFESLIAEYGTDPGMQDAATLAAGYSVHNDSIAYDSAFTQGAFSDKMTAVGAVSDPVVGSYGVHILYYLSDVPGGPVELSQDIHDTIYNYLYNSACNEIFTGLSAQWVEQYGVTYNEEAINAFTSIAQTETTETETAE